MAARRVQGNKRKYCPFSSKKIPVEFIDYKNFRFLRKYITETGKIVPSRITGVKNIYQHMLAREIKYARFLALIPYCDRH
ncbi:30S ribosomal protein S18 [Candidatus Berkiella cookevillensis]|uniref:Small ribosomal subunit protein bS18 n=1 Tax=Candidatus Berkiella cookevillensis TaxID=437022 RepID=A0A0Q9YG85_9GAMM|nr:30S ribosomal protein S18 [Candidatus Berkiella cookevillensis]MCS5707562.1 30S ribosomal protein S18 [Candidatus Berkiella cookevillensis]